MNKVMKATISLCYLLLILTIVPLPGTPKALAAETTLKQSVFLICPHKEKYSAWSLFLMVDASDPAKGLSLGLEKLVKHNSKDTPYEAVLEAQTNEKTEREQIGMLEAKDFNGGMIEVKKDNALKVSVSPASDGGLRLMLSMRINADQRFVIGGKEQSKRDVVFRYDREKKSWAACAVALVDAEGKKVAISGCKPMSGIVFPVTGTGIYQIVASVDNTESIMLMDK